MRYAVGRWAEGRLDRQPSRMFSVGGRSTSNTAAAANECVGNLWNPSSTRSVWVAEFSWSNRDNPAAVDTLRFCRTSTAGTTPASTVTPDADNDFERETSPQAGVLLHLANFATEPVLELPELFRLVIPASGSPHSLTWLFRGGIRVRPSTGLALATTGAVAEAPTDVTFRFWE